MILNCIAGCINSYKGEYGNVPSPFDSWEEFKSGHVEGYFAMKGPDLYGIFRGSDGKGDWVDNFKYWHRVLPYKESGTKESIRVHTGFYEQYISVRHLIHIKIKEFKSQPGHGVVVVTGHSLGGALATLCSLDIQYNHFSSGSDAVVCVTFGSPRVGNKAFRDSYNRYVPNSLRHVNGDDVVCKVPPVLFGYLHVSSKVSIGKKKWYRYVSGSTDDHYPEAYLRSLHG